MDAEQKQKLADLCAQQHVAVLTTQGEAWPTAHLQAFGQTDELDLIFIMLADAEKYSNLLTRPQATVAIDNRDTADVSTLQVARATIQGLATEVARDSAEWGELKERFLTKNPFEEPFFGYDSLRMMRLAPKRISYANGLADTFKVEL